MNNVASEWREWHAAAWPDGWTVLHVDQTGSTNDDLLGAVLDGTVGAKTALVTAHQTAGRGRLDRRWDAPVGSNLLVTLYFGDTDPVSASRVTQRVGVAIVEGVDELAGVPVDGLGLKWPNDVMLGERKLAGVLAQGRSHGAGLAMVVGFGLNVGWAPDGAASVRDDVAGLERLEPAAALAAVLRSIERGTSDVAARYRRRLVTLGRRVRIELPADRVVIGVASGIGDDGTIEVTDDDGTTRRFDAGDVVHLRTTDR